MPAHIPEKFEITGGKDWGQTQRATGKQFSPMPDRKDPNMPPPWAREQPATESVYSGYAPEGGYGGYAPHRSGNNGYTPPTGTKAMDDILDKSLDVNDPRNMWTNTKGVHLEPVQNDEKIASFFKDWNREGKPATYARNQALAKLRKNYQNNELGHIDVSGQGIREVVSRCRSDDGAKSIALIPEIIENGRLYRIMPDANDTKGSIVKVYQMATEVKIEGKSHIAITTIKEEHTGRKLYYGHELERLPDNLPENLDLFGKLKLISHDQMPRIPNIY